MTGDGVRLVLAGAGLRGVGYARLAVGTGNATVAAVAEPDPLRRERFAAEFGVPENRAFADWRELAEAGKLGDAVLVTTQDHMHADPTVTFADLGYHILLEKPMATTEPDAIRIADAVDRAKVIFAVCHVLRYTPYTRVLKRLLDAGRIGRLVSAQHLEPVGWWHHAHSFVRGHWNNSSTSAPMLLTKPLLPTSVHWWLWKEQRSPWWTWPKLSCAPPVLSSSMPRLSCARWRPRCDAQSWTSRERSFALLSTAS
jgi:predicted dehydrogenase